MRTVVIASVLVIVMGGTGLAADGDKAPTVTLKRDFAPVSGKIDALVHAGLTAEKMPISPRADDAEFLRRIHLDVAGIIPTAEQAIAFLDDAEAAKRARLIDTLLASPQYGKRLADTWEALLIDRTSDNRRVVSEPLVKWLEDRFNANQPWNQLVGDLLTATGTQEENGATTFWITTNMVDKATDTISKVFMGVQLQCAQCHNHPFTSWKQEEYWGMAQFFTKVRLNGNPRNAANRGVALAVSEEAKGGGRAPRLPESAKNVPPRFFQGEEPNVGRGDPLRPVLAKWLTAPDNPFFARAMVNRTWAQFFGRGLVHPVDDMGGHEPSHPEVLDLLANEFTASGFDLHHLTRCICNTATYQRTSKPLPGNEKDVTLLSHAIIKPLTPEQMFDSLQQVVGTPPEPQGRQRNKPAQANRGQPANARRQFVNFFGVDENADPTEYQGGIPQALRLMNAPQLNNTGLIGQVVKPDVPATEIIEQLYLATLARRPNQAEVERIAKFVGDAGEPKKAYGDVLWALLNSSEFALNH